jgi:predicted Zn-dependent peptidase
MDRFQVSEKTAYGDYAGAMNLLQTEQVASKSDLLNQIQALRLVTIQKALKRGQLQTVATLLKDLGAVVGEVAPEQLAAQAPQLNLVIEPPALPDANEPQILPAEIELVSDPLLTEDSQSEK